MRSLLGRWSLPAASLTAALISGGLVLGVLSAPAGAESPEQTLGRPRGQAPAHSAPAAAEALAQVQELLTPAPVHARSSEVTPKTGRDLTMALRDLRLRQADLSTVDRSAAADLVVAPATNQCSTFGGGKVAVHWTTTGADRADYSWAQKVATTAGDVLARYAKAGYRAPKSDGTEGNTTGCTGGSYLDIYLSDLGSDGLYGYCDTKHVPSSQGPYDTSAYCAFDNDYREFPGQTPDHNLQVTVAHELFHAVQFAYDYREDLWFMEATAAWAEDELYDSINDNRQFLPYGPLRHPGVAIDNSGSGFNTAQRYGSWIFFRYLSEQFPATSGGMPVVMRRLWTRADGSAHGKDAYSLQSIAQELRSHHTSLRTFAARFADANRHPRRSYSEGGAYRFAPAAASVKPSRSKRDSGWRSIKRNHLTSATVAVAPGKGLAGSWRLRIDVDLPNVSRGSAALVTAYGKSGKQLHKWVPIGARGNGHTFVLFTPRRIKRVDVVLSNAGNHFDCWEGTPFSCSGKSKDDHRVLKYRVRAVR